MDEKQKTSRADLISTTFLVAGACIGGGMLGLPVATSLTGFAPSIVMLLVSWIMMTLSALLILEVNLWLGSDSHIITMASEMLGRKGKIVAWILYLFIGYASLVSYTSGGGSYIANLINYSSHLSIDRWVGCIFFTLLFGSSLYLGSRFIGRLNTILFIAMIFSYLLLTGVGIPEIKIDLLTERHWKKSLILMPLLLTAFSFQSIVPSLTPMLQGNAKLLRISIIGGTSIALLIYTLWQVVILGAIPIKGPYGLQEAYAQGAIATDYLRYAVDSAWISTTANFFAFFALVTSYLGIALGLFDFLADGLKIEKKGIGNITLGLLVALPTLFFSIKYPRAFLVAMETSGGFGDAILNGIMPVMMVWVGRYYKNMSANYRVTGGKPLLVGVFLFYSGVFILEFFEQFSETLFFSID